MKIAILTDYPKAYSQTRLMQVGQAQGHEMVLLKASSCYLNITEIPAQVHYHDDCPIQGLQALIPRISARASSYATVLLKQFEWMGVKTLNSALAIHSASDKLRAMQLMVQRQIAMPVTGFADSPQQAERLIEVVGGAPLMVKLLESRTGHGTVYAGTQQAAASVINALKQLKAKILVQECIGEARGRDIRAMVIGQKVVAAIQRQSLDLEATGQTPALAVKLTAEERRLAIFAVKAMKLNSAVVHLLRAQRGPLVLDIDPAASFEALESITGVDIATQLLDFTVQGI